MSVELRFSSGFGSVAYTWGFPVCLLSSWPLCVSDSTVTLLEQQPRWGLVRRGQALTLRCILKNSQYPWMSWYQQDLQQQLQWLFSLGSSGDKEAKSLPGADYLATRITDTELRLQVANMTQSRTLFCTCSKDTVVSSAGALEQKPHTHRLPCLSILVSLQALLNFLPFYPDCLSKKWTLPDLPLFFSCLSHTVT